MGLGAETWTPESGEGLEIGAALAVTEGVRSGGGGRGVVVLSAEGDTLDVSGEEILLVTVGAVGLLLLSAPLETCGTAGGGPNFTGVGTLMTGGGSLTGAGAGG